MAMARPCLGYYRHGKWLRSGLNSNEWLVSSLARNPSKLPTKYLGNGCGICSLSECQEDKIKKSAIGSLILSSLNNLSPLTL